MNGTNIWSDCTFAVANLWIFHFCCCCCFRGRCVGYVIKCSRWYKSKCCCGDNGTANNEANIIKGFTTRIAYRAELSSDILFFYGILEQIVYIWLTQSTKNQPLHLCSMVCYRIWLRYPFLDAVATTVEATWNKCAYAHTLSQSKSIAFYFLIRWQCN